MEKEFNKKTVMITGATGGVGEACVRLFAEDGANLVLVGTRMERLEALVKRLDLKTPYLLFAADAADEKAVKQIVSETCAKFGGIDVLVNTLGIAGPAASLEDYPYEDFKRVYEINVFGVFLTMKYVLPVMKKQRSGAIVNTASISGMGGYALEAGYGSSKFAVIGLTKDAASECPDNGVRVNCISGCKKVS